MELVELAFFTDNVEEMVAFYGRLVGVKPVAQSEDMAVFTVGHTKIFIHRHYEPAEGELPPDNHIAFAVDDVDAIHQHLRQQGLVPEAPPRDYYWGRSTYFRDPDGNQIEITKAESGGQ